MKASEYVIVHLLYIKPLRALHSVYICYFNCLILFVSAAVFSYIMRTRLFSYVYSKRERHSRQKLQKAKFEDIRRNFFHNESSQMLEQLAQRNLELFYRYSKLN